MSLIDGFFDEISFFQSICSSFQWREDKLIVNFDKGVDLRGSSHPLADSLKEDEPCRVIYEGVVESKLKISQLISKPNNFDVHYFEKEALPKRDSIHSYEEFYMEGTIKGDNPQGWFTWDIVAKKVTLDDLK